MMWTLFSTLACTSSLFIGLIVDAMHWEGSWMIYLVGIILGGLEITIEGLQELMKEKQFNVDLLMIIAAVSAGIIGDWREGALPLLVGRYIYAHGGVPVSCFVR